MRSRSLPRIAVPARAALAVTAVVLIAAAFVTSTPSDPRATASPPAALSDRLGPHTWAYALPVTWLSAPIPGLRSDDVLDLLGARPGERATATEVATGLRVMALDERTLVVELTADDATSITAARARGLSLVPILRSAR